MRQRRIALDSIQQSRIEALARTRGLACDVFGSLGLFSAEEAHRTPAAAHPGSVGGVWEFALSPEEARRIGLG